MRILFLPKYYPEGASSRYRTHNYLEYFMELGCEVTVKPLFFEGYVQNLYQKKSKDKLKMLKDYLNRIIYLLLNKKKFDIIIIEKELLPYIPYQFEKFLLRNTTYTLDYDDAISTRYRGNKIFKKVLGNKVNSLSNNATLTSVGNKWYWEEITEGHLEYLPTVIDLKKYPIDKLQKKVNNIPIIVWIGSPSTVKYLKALENVFIRLSQKFEFKLRIIGGNIDIRGVNVEFLPWSEESEFEYLFTSDIGIMPLQRSPWEYGKCGFKCIQYMAAGLPVVASSLPANKEIILHEETGFIVESENEWYKYLKLLLQDANMRYEYGKKARYRIEEKYSYQVWGSLYVDYIKKLI
jgi:glycosyltransferase involved in cell wall biosynthesis